MPIGPVPVDLNQGLELASSVLAKRPGSLIDCLNYEYTGSDGLRRIDGYEAYDGWTNGSVSDIWSVTVTVSNPGLFSAAVVGDLVRLLINGSWLTVGVLLEKGASSIVYTPLNKDQAKLRSGDNLAFGSSTTITLQVSTEAEPLYDSMTPSAYLQEVRDYQATMRAAVTEGNTPICGLHVFRNNVIVARDAPRVTITGISASLINVGDYVAIGTLSGLVIAKDSTNYWIEPYTDGTVNTSINVRNKDGTVAASATATTVTIDRGESEHAYLMHLETPDTSFTRGERTMWRSTILTFDNGTQAAGADPKVGDIINIGPSFGVNDYRGIVKSIVLTSGTWAAGTAAGRMEVVFANPFSPGSGSGFGPINRFAVGDTVRIGANSIFVIDAITRTVLPGTLALRRNASRYVAETYNFSGTDENFAAYGATGASRAFWAQVYNVRGSTFKSNPPSISGEEIYRSYGNIIVNPDSVAFDNPKFVSLHGRSSLALGFMPGEVAFSVIYEPHNFNGLDGAQVLTTGDEVTGLVEAVGDTTVVFGRRSICRVSGAVDALTMNTVSPKSGAYPYTCAVVGRVPVFVDHSGISTLEQSETYSDFVGERSSFAVDPQLRPRLLTSFAGTEIGGVHCAFAVRGKSQYRLFLRSGKVFTMCITSQGPKFAISNYSNDDVPRLPFAWSCQIMDSGKEMIIASWDPFYAKYAPVETPEGTAYTGIDQKELYELDSGWGFNGDTFNHYFVVAHMFMDAAANNIQLARFRMFGKSFGFASLDSSSAGIDMTFDEEFSSTRDASLPQRVPAAWKPLMDDAMSFTHIGNWGLGIKLKIQNKYAKGEATTEPPHVCQLIVLYTDTTGAQDG